MLVASELRGELARIRPARACCRRAELVGLLQSAGADGGVRTLDHATARIAVQLAASIGVAATAPRASATGSRVPGRHHLQVELGDGLPSSWEPVTRKACDRRAFLRGLLLSMGSVSGGHGGPHVEFVLRDRRSANELRHLLEASDVRSRHMQRRGRHVIYLKGQEEIAGLLRLIGANRALEDCQVGQCAYAVRAVCVLSDPKAVDDGRPPGGAVERCGEP